MNYIGTTMTEQLECCQSHSCGGTLQKNLDLKLLHSSMQTSADYRSRRRHVCRMTDEKGETWSPSGMSYVRICIDLVTKTRWPFGNFATANFRQIWPRNVIRGTVDESWKTLSKIFTLGSFAPRVSKFEVGETGTSLRAGYRSQDALQRDNVYPTL